MVSQKNECGRRLQPGRWAMAVLFVAGVLLAVLPGAGCSGTDETATTGDPGGRLQLVETYHDFGTVPVDQKVEYQFLMKNTGTGPLNLGQMEVKRLEGC